MGDEALVDLCLKCGVDGVRGKKVNGLVEWEFVLLAGRRDRTDISGAIVECRIMRVIVGELAVTGGCLALEDLLPLLVASESGRGWDSGLGG